VTYSHLYPSSNNHIATVSLFSKLQNTSHLIVQGPWGSTSHFVSLIVTMPALISVEWSLVSFRWPQTRLKQINGLRRLIYTGPTAFSVGSAALETNNLTDLIVASSSTLEHIDAQGKCMDLKSLSRHMFPNLFDLILRGAIYSTPEMVPIGAFISRAPQLRVLEIHLLSRPILEFEVYPALRPLPLFHPLHLRSLLIYDIVRGDQILRVLPRTLRSLSLLLGDYEYLYDARCLLHQVFTICEIF
jgi:hypothetical protein